MICKYVLPPIIYWNIPHVFKYAGMIIQWCYEWIVFYGLKISAGQITDIEVLFMVQKYTMVSYLNFHIFVKNVGV